jgi:hypothetical protein
MGLTAFADWQQSFGEFDPQFNSRTVTHGFEKLFWAPVNNDGTFGTPKAIVGARNIELTPEENQNTQYADNIVHYNTFISSLSSGSLVVYNEVEPSFAQHALGWKQDLAKSEGLFDGHVRSPFVLGYVEIIEGNNLPTKEYKLTIFYNVVAGKPGVVAATDEGDVTAKEHTFALSASQSNSPDVVVNGIVPTVGIFYYSQNPTIFDLFMKEVIVPGKDYSAAPLNN